MGRGRHCAGLAAGHRRVAGDLLRHYRRHQRYYGGGAAPAGAPAHHCLPPDRLGPDAAPPTRATPLPGGHSGVLAAPPVAATATPLPSPTAVPTATATPDPELRLP